MKIYLIGILTDDNNWMCEGIFLDEDSAVQNCGEEEFIVPVNTPGRLPIEATDAEYLWWPHKSTKEEAMQIMTDKRLESK